MKRVRATGKASTGMTSEEIEEQAAKLVAPIDRMIEAIRAIPKDASALEKVRLVIEASKNLEDLGDGQPH